MRIRAVLVAGVVVAALAGPSPSQATLTLGPNLAALTPAPAGYDCGNTHGCTLVNGSVGAGLGSSLLVSPVTGSISRLRVRTGPGGAGSIGFRLLRPIGGGAYQADATFGVVPPSLPPNSTTEFPAFPITRGEAIGVDCCRGGFDNITSATVAGSGSFLAFGTGTNPFFDGNQPRSPDSTQSDQLVMLNADIDPISGIGVTKSKMKGAAVKLTATAFNPGVVTVTGKLFKRKTAKLDVPISGGPPVSSGIVRMLIKPRKSKRARVRHAASATLQITYTPTFGTTTTEAVEAERSSPKTKSR